MVWFVITGNDTEQSQQKNTIQRSSEYGMTDFKMTIMNEEGVPARVITGKQMEFFSETDTTKIERPIAYFVEENEDTWVIQSQHGETQGKGETIHLSGEVLISRESNNEIALATDKLTIDTKYNTAYTDQKVLIQSPYGDTESVGLHAALADETINLHSKVKGQYNAPSTQ